MRFIVLFIVCLVKGIAVSGQSANTNNGSNRKDQLVFTTTIPQKALFLLSYSEQSYWWSNEDRYQILAYDGKVWTAWKYSKKWKTSGERYEKGLPLKSKYYWKIRVIDSTTVSILLDSLQRAEIWTLNKDSLGSTRGYSIYDAVDYIFQVENAGEIRVISSYAPEDYLENFPDMTHRIMFIKARDIFNRWWKKNCS